VLCSHRGYKKYILSHGAHREHRDIKNPKFEPRLGGTGIEIRNPREIVQGTSHRAGKFKIQNTNVQNYLNVQC